MAKKNKAAAERLPGFKDCLAFTPKKLEALRAQARAGQLLATKKYIRCAVAKAIAGGLSVSLEAGRGPLSGTDLLTPADQAKIFDAVMAAVVIKVGVRHA